MRFRSYIVALATSVLVSTKLAAAPVVIDTVSLGVLNYTANGANATNGTNQTGVDTPDGRRASYIDHLFAPGTTTVTQNNGPITASADNFVFVLGYGETYIGGGMGVGPDINA